MTATAAATNVVLPNAEGVALMRKTYRQMLAARTAMHLTDTSGYCYAFREVPGFAMHANGKGLVSLTARGAEFMRNRLPQGRQFENKAGHVAVYMPMADAIADALASINDVIATLETRAREIGVDLDAE